MRFALRSLPLLALLVAATAAAQGMPPPVLAAVDVYGSRKVSKEQVLALAALPVGKVIEDEAALRAALREAEKKVGERFPLAYVKASYIRYFPNAGEAANKAYVTFDLVDRGDEARLAFAPAPSGEVPDPDGLVSAWLQYEKRAEALLSEGKLVLGSRDEDRCSPKAFHCALGFAHPELQPMEERFFQGVPKSFAGVQRVLLEGKDPDARAAAAFLLAYAPTRDQAVGALLKAVRDPSPEVRNNVLRVLFKAQEGAERPVLPYQVLYSVLRFPATTDRNKALYSLLSVLKKDPKRSAAAVLGEVGDVLLATAALQQPNNRDPALEVMKLLSGKDLGRDVAAWERWAKAARGGGAGAGTTRAEGRRPR